MKVKNKGRVTAPKPKKLQLKNKIKKHFSNGKPGMVVESKKTSSSKAKALQKKPSDKKNQSKQLKNQHKQLMLQHNGNDSTSNAEESDLEPDLEQRSRSKHDRANKAPKTKAKKSVKKSEKKPKPQEPESESDANLTEDEDMDVSLESDTDSEPATKQSKKKAKKSDKNALKLHKKDLEGLKDLDPEFYQFLKQNDKKLLEFGIDESEDDEKDSDQDDIEEKEDDEGIIHKPTGDLEVASDESDYHDSDADDDEDSGTKVVALKLLHKWQIELESKKVKMVTIRNVIQAFSSALASISDGRSGASIYKVVGGAAFNGVIQLCVLYLQPAIYRFMGLPEKSQTALHKCKKWKRVRTPLKDYLVDLSRLVEHVTSSNIMRVVLKHLHQVSAMVASFPHVSKPILKRLIVLWSTSEEETVRVLAFLCILKITRAQQTSLLNHILKAMYLAYVRNSKFVSPNNLANINFMRRSLVEMFALDLNLTYQHAFLYVRQLAIHLRNAVILKKKDSFQAVYNWQFVNSIKLWADLLGSTANKPQLQPLIYPLISITTGVIKLIPTAQYFPLRFHCIQALINLQKQSNTFIPVLPFILEVLNSNTFNKKHSVASMKPMSFACILRLNKSQMAENGFRDEVVEQVCGLTLEYLAHESHTISYPELVVPCVIALKQYLKVCKNANYARKLKQVLDKIVENAKFVEQERKKYNFGLQDTSQINAWETKLLNRGTPLNTYYTSWRKTHEVKRKRQAANTDDINDYDVPTIKRKKPSEKEKNESNDGPVELFPSGSEDEAEVEGARDGERPSNKEKVKKKKQKKVIKDSEQTDEKAEEDVDDENCVDIVKDLDLDDW